MFMFGVNAGHSGLPRVPHSSGKYPDQPAGQAAGPQHSDLRDSEWCPGARSCGPHRHTCRRLLECDRCTPRARVASDALHPVAIRDRDPRALGPEILRKGVRRLVAVGESLACYLNGVSCLVLGAGMCWRRYEKGTGCHQSGGSCHTECWGLHRDSHAFPVVSHLLVFYRFTQAQRHPRDKGLGER